MPATTKVSVYTSNGAVVFIKNNVERECRVKLKSGVYFVHIAGLKNGAVQKVVILQ
jgi:hypothetical protein